MIASILSILLVITITNVTCVSAAGTGMQFGDGLALVLGIFLTTLGILACLGKYARKLSVNQY